MRLPIRLRLTLVFGLLMAGLLIGLAAFVSVRVEQALIAGVDAGLESRAGVLMDQAAAGDLPANGPLVDSDEAFAQLVSADGRVLDGTRGLEPTPLVDRDVLASLSGPELYDVEARTPEEALLARVLAVPTSSGAVLIVGASLEDQLDALAQLRGQLLVGVPIGILLATLVGWLVAGAALRPVERLRTEAQAISGSELGRRLAVPNTGDELARLAESLNRMLGRLEDAVERERRFVGDASHELRTPLANLKAELDLSLRRARTTEELLGALRSAKEETDRLTGLAEDLLVLARTEDGRLPVRRERVDVARLVREIVASFESRASDLGIALAARSDGELAADVDGTRLRQAIGNLIDNALRHTRPGGRVEIGVQEADGVLTISVADSGEGFDAQFLARAFEPFSRVDSARSRAHGGTGLGLAIVRAVAEGHGGSVSAANGPEGGGLVEIRLPATGGALI